MSKYNTLWSYLQKRGEDTFQLSFDEIVKIAGVPVDHSFLNAKKEAEDYGYTVGKISLKESFIRFVRMK